MNPNHLRGARNLQPPHSKRKKSRTASHPAALWLLGLLATLPISAQPPADASELWIEDGGYPRKFERVVASAGTNRATAALAGDGESLILVERGMRQTRFSERRLTRMVLVTLIPGTDPQEVARRVPAARWQEVWYAPGHYIFEARTAQETLLLWQQLLDRREVVSAQPLLGKRYRSRTVPQDPLFSQQWHLRNTGQRGGLPGVDLNVLPAWSSVKGRGVVVAVVDDGVQWDHPDLMANVALDLSHDYRDGDSDARPSAEDIHGTPVAGLIGARDDNGIGVAGVAPRARLAAVRLIGGEAIPDSEYADALLHLRDIVQISNNSWGPDDTGDSLEAPGLLVRLALERGAWSGRQGRGTIYVFSAGNGGDLQEDANYDGFANSIYTIAVGAVNDQGLRPDYSEPGACLVVSAPSDSDWGSSGAGLVTTDLLGQAGWNSGFGDLADRDYTGQFGGTSGAAPQVSGVAALMLEANPELGWRDVQEILIRSARKVDPAGIGWLTNSAGLHFNPDYGAGLVDAGAASQMAASWSNLSLHTERTVAQANADLAIPDNDPGGATLKFQLSGEPLVRVEHVIVTVDIPHPRRGDLRIELISPSGTTSLLADKHLDPNPNYPLWPLMSVFHWGEWSEGEWQLRISDLRQNQAGRLNYAQLRLFGSAVPKLHLAASNAETRLVLVVTGAPLARFELEGSSDLWDWTPLIDGQLDGEGSFQWPVTNEGWTGAKAFFRARQLPQAGEK